MQAFTQCNQKPYRLSLTWRFSQSRGILNAISGRSECADWPGWQIEREAITTSDQSRFGTARQYEQKITEGRKRGHC